MTTNTGISEEASLTIAGLLNQLLADEHILFMKLRNAHWNVEGSDFHAQHLFLETLYIDVEGKIDAIAERVRAIGHYAVGTLREYLTLSQLEELQYRGHAALGYYEELLKDVELLIQGLREAITQSGDLGDAGTEDFLVGIMADHEKTAWMLRSFLK